MNREIEVRRFAWLSALDQTGKIGESDACIGGDQIDAKLVFDLIDVDIDKGLRERESIVPAETQAIQVPSSAAGLPGKRNVVLECISPSTWPNESPITAD